jgi:DNA-directed RNA polymerase specialized sigma24 family protein
LAAVQTSTADAMERRFRLAQPEYRGRIRAFAHHNFRTIPGFEKQDLEAELLEVLWLACVAYDPNQGACFNTLFWTCANRRFLDLHKAASRKMRVGDYDRVWLDDEDVREQLNEYLDHSAEDEAIAMMVVEELYRSGKADRD